MNPVNHDQTRPSAGLAAFLEVTSGIVASLDVEETLAAIVRAITEIVDCDIGALFLIDEESSLLSNRATHGSRMAEWETLRLSADRGINWRAVKSGQVQRLDDYQQLGVDEQVDTEIVRGEPIRSVIVAPVNRRGRRLGAVGGYRRVVRPFRTEDEFLLARLADLAAIAVDNALAYSELETARRRLEALVATTDAVWRPLPFRQIASLVVRQATAILPGVHCLVAVVEPDRPGYLEYVAGSPGWAEAIVGTRHRLADTSLVNDVFEQRSTLESSTYSSLSAQAARLAGDSGIETARLIPLLAEERPGDRRPALGILNFFRVGKTPFSGLERDLMDEFAKRVSVALHRAELLDGARETTARQREAIEAAADLSGSLDPEEVIRRVLTRALAAARADRGVLLRIEGSETVVEDSSDVTGLEDIVGYRADISTQPLMAEAILTRQPVFGGRYDVESMAPPLRLALADVRHTATLPLVLDDRVAAVLVLSRRSDRIFLAGDLVTLELIANQAALALRNARLFAQVREAGRAQSDFLNMAAHELRTPLTVIAGYVSMLLDGSLGDAPERWRVPIETIDAKTRELEALISDLLTASRLEAGRLAVVAARVDLGEAARDAVLRALPRAHLLGGEIELEGPLAGVAVSGDQEHLGRILDNLINNALSYSPLPPYVKVVVEDAAQPAIRVEDRGFGIPVEERERIFERFYRIDDPEVRHLPGTGLGLSISRELALRMGGFLELVSSLPGAGSVFAVRLGRVSPARPQ